MKYFVFVIINLWILAVIHVFFNNSCSFPILHEKLHIVIKIAN